MTNLSSELRTGHASAIALLGTLLGAAAMVFIALLPGLTFLGLGRPVIGLATFAFTLASVVVCLTTCRATAVGAASVVTFLAAGAGTLLALLASVEQSSHGRRLRRFFTLRAAGTATGTGWLARGEAGPGASVPPSLRAPLAAAFREVARREHASIAAFDHVALELLAVGAPPDLVESAHRDALDEIRHATQFFGLARDLDGSDEGPAPFPAARRPSFDVPTRTLRLGKLAIEAITDGLLNEGHSARLLASLAKTCEVPTIRDVLVRAAADEARHASHSLAIVRWCLETGGPEVTAIVRAAVRHLPSRMTAETSPGAADGAWERWGVHGAGMDARAWRDTKARADQVIEALLAS